MKPTPKTIQISLPNGDPRGIRIADFDGSSVRVIEVPRRLMHTFIKMPESHQVAVCFTIGSAAPNEQWVEIDRTRECMIRAQQMGRWAQRALVIISHSFEESYSMFLQWHCQQAIQWAGRYKILTDQDDYRPETPTSVETECLKDFEAASTLLTTLGYPLFVPLKCSEGVGNGEEVFHCIDSEADGRAVYNQDGFVMLAGSAGPSKNSPSIRSHWEKVREDWVRSGVMKEQDGRFVFPNDYLFASPIHATVALLGCRVKGASGWVEWKNDAGKTLDEVVRRGDDC